MYVVSRSLFVVHILFMLRTSFAGTSVGGEYIICSDSVTEASKGSDHCLMTFLFIVSHEYRAY